MMAEEGHYLGQPGGFLRRLAGYILDIIFLAPLVAVMVMAMPVGAMMNVTLSFLIVVLYYAALCGSPWCGTVGKHLLHLKVVGCDGQGISYFRAVVRFILQMVPFLPFLGFGLLLAYMEETGVHLYITNDDELVFFQWVIGTSILFTFLLSVVWYSPIFFTREKKGVHNMLCRTRVVMVPPIKGEVWTKT